MQNPMMSERLEKIASEIVDAAYKVHRALGPGLLESVYETCLAHELRKRGLEVRTQVVLPLVYDDLRLDSGLRLDMLVEGTVVVEVKAVELTQPVHHAQLLSCLQLTGCRLGFLINFHVPIMKDGIKRMVR